MHFRLIIAAIFIGGMVFAQGNLPEPKGGEAIYVVRSGDTLWDISKRFYGNPLLWPRLWELNSFIDNPNLIYPGQVLSLKPKFEQPGTPVVKIKPGIEEEQLKDIGAPPPVYYYSKGGSEGFISPDEWEHMGTILSSEPPKILLGEGDIVYTNVGRSDGVQSGDLFTVFRTSKPVLHPFTGRRIGYNVAIFGEIEIVDVLGEKMSTAKITNSYRAITRGARIRPREPFVNEVTIKKGTEAANGMIVDSLNELEVLGQGNIVYIDVGKEHSIVPGNTFSIYTLPRSVRDPDSSKDVTIPPSNKGKLVVFNVEQNTSTGLIIRSARPIQIGDLVSLDF
jgi:LysM repeat protein